MRAVEQWKGIESELPEGWEEARLSFTVEDPKAAPGAAEVLAPLNPGRFGSELRFHVQRSGTSGVESVRNLLERLDRRRIWGGISLLEARVPEKDLVAQSHKEEKQPRSPLARGWDKLVETLPSDWSDLLCELELDSSDYLPRAALLGAPLNPTRNPDAFAFRFRVGRKGYGVSRTMARRCLERMDAERITGRLTVVNALADVGNVATQGPVWRVAGRSV